MTTYLVVKKTKPENYRFNEVVIKFEARNDNEAYNHLMNTHYNFKTNKQLMDFLNSNGLLLAKY